MRELDRERTKMEQQEKKIIADIKKMAKQGSLVTTSDWATTKFVVISWSYFSSSNEYNLKSLSNVIFSLEIVLALIRETQVFK